MLYVRFLGVTSQTLAHNPCPMLVARTVGNRTPAHQHIVPFFSTDSMLRGFGVLLRVDRMLVDAGGSEKLEFNYHGLIMN